MPRGVPLSGKRAKGAGRPKKYGSDTVPIRVPVEFAGKMGELYTFLHELDAEITAWEAEINARDISKNPRYSKAKELATSIRERINALGVLSE